MRPGEFSPTYPEYPQKGDLTLETIHRDVWHDQVAAMRWIPAQWLDADRWCREERERKRREARRVEPAPFYTREERRRRFALGLDV